MSFEQAVRIPLERVGAVIGRDGATKKSLEAELGIKLGVDSREGLVTIKSDSVDQGDPFIAVRSSKPSVAVSRLNAPSACLRRGLLSR
ncbi:MAG: KH domain-containing protein [Nitrososphaerales archaeon]